LTIAIAGFAGSAPPEKDESDALETDDPDASIEEEDAPEEDASPEDTTPGADPVT